MANQRPEVETVNAWAVAISLAVLLASVFGFVYGTAHVGWYQAAVYGVSSTLLSIGLVSILYELLLRRSVGRELLRLVGIQRSVVTNGLTNLGQASDFEWNPVLGGASHFRILLTDPASWIEANLVRITTAGKERSIDVMFFFPNPDGPYFAAIAAHHSMTPDDLRQSVVRARTVVEESWKLSANAKSLHKGSRIRISLFDGFPSYTLVRADRAVVVVLPSSTGKLPGESGFYASFVSVRDHYPISWFVDEFTRLESNAAVFENTVS